MKRVLSPKNGSQLCDSDKSKSPNYLVQPLTKKHSLKDTTKTMQSQKLKSNDESSTHKHLTQNITSIDDENYKNSAKIAQKGTLTK